MHVADLIRDGKTTSMEALELEDVPVAPVELTGASRISDAEASRYWR